jgi:putative nucleotidyltransferase with HDIG domain
VPSSPSPAGRPAGPLLRRGCVPGDLTEQASRVSRQLLGRLDDDGRRWHHTEAVAARAGRAAALLPPVEADVLRAAAWLHDVGYTPALHRLRFHPVDGAAFLRDHLGWPAVAGLVAHHSGARFVAAVRGMTHLMQPFARREYWTGPLADALTWADQTTGPDGGTVEVEERLREMLARHGADSPNARAHARRAPVLIAAVRATEARLAGAARLREAGAAS